MLVGICGSHFCGVYSVDGAVFDQATGDLISLWAMASDGPA